MRNRSIFNFCILSSALAIFILLSQGSYGQQKTADKEKGKKKAVHRTAFFIRSQRLFNNIHEVLSICIVEEFPVCFCLCLEFRIYNGLHQVFI